MALDLDFYDAELRWYNEHFRAAADVRSQDHVLDIGCGTGQSTRQAAHAAAGGSVLGVDLSAPMLERARQLTDDEQLHNVTYQRADAQTHPFPPSHFDVCISRFGTMFFAEPTVAFTNVGRALQPGARLVLVVWQSQDCNEWATAIDRALDTDSASAQPVTGSDPFSLADPAVTQAVLAAAGFTKVQFSDLHEPVYYGEDADAAYEATLGLWRVRTKLADLDAATRERTLRRLRATIAARDTDSGVLFDSRAWIVSGIRP